MKKLSLLFIVLCMLLSLSACKSTPKEDEVKETFDVAGKTYYNTVDEYGHDTHAKVWFGKDGSFVLNDSYSGGYYDIDGSWALKENVLTLTVDKTGQGSFSKIIFEVEDNDTLKLKTTLEGSKSDDTFSVNEVKGSSGTSSESEKPSSETNPETLAERIPCTGLTSLYKNYWAYEGVKNYDLEVKAEPANTTDKITYTSDDENVVKVNENGIATAVNAGTTKIHIKCGDIEKTVGFETRKKGAVTKLVPESDKIVLPLGGREPIKVKIEPESATDKTLTYKSSDPSVFTFDDENRILPHHPGVGKATITASNGISATVDVCVEGSFMVVEMPDNPTVKGGSGEYIYFECYKLKCENWNVTNEDLRLAVDIHVSDQSIIDYDNKGRLIAVGSVSSNTDVQVWFSFEDEDLYPEVTSKTYTVHVTP